MKSLTVTTLKAAKGKLLNDNKTLHDIIKEENIDCTPMELNDALIRKYGTDVVGNPIEKARVIRRANKMVDQALIEFPKAKVLELLNDLIAKVNES